MLTYIVIGSVLLLAGALLFFMCRALTNAVSSVQDTAKSMEPEGIPAEPKMQQKRRA